MNFPENCIRGIPNDSFINEDGSLGSHLFHFLSANRGDGWVEQSINWEDDANAVKFTLSVKKADGQIQFKAGAAIVPRSEMDRLNSRPTVMGLLSYERQTLSDNAYHGNILLRANTPKPTMKLLAAGIALAVTRIICP